MNKKKDESNNHTFLSGAASTTFCEAMAYLFEHNLGENSLIRQHILNNYNLVYHESKTESNTPLRISSNVKQYPMHILIRYELEKNLINGSLPIDELNDQWKQMYRTLLNIKDLDDIHGILQDPHWFNAQFGYFPCYAIGRAYASQVKNALDKSVEFDECIKNQDLKVPITWFEKNIYRFGASKNPNEILLQATGEQFNPKYYISDLGYSK